MKEQLSALYELQGLDVEIARVRAGLASLDGAKALKQKLSAAEAKAEAVERALAKQEAELRDSELKLKSIDEKRGSFEKRLYGGTVRNPKELAAIEKEVNILKKQQGDLDGRTLELYDVVEKAREEAKAAGKTREQLSEQVSQALADETDKRARLDEQLAELTARREDAVARVTDNALLSRYEAVRNKTGTTGVAKVVGRRCEGCRVMVTEFTMRKLHEDKDYQSCENCGRILFLDTSCAD